MRSSAKAFTEFESLWLKLVLLASSSTSSGGSLVELLPVEDSGYLLSLLVAILLTSERERDSD